MGDGAMIVFGLPRAAPDDAARALEAALALGTDVGAWLREHPLVAASRIGVRVGAHYGPVVVSRLGSETHQHITATGDSVNVASRLLEVVAANDVVAAVSEDLLTAVGGEIGGEGARRYGFSELREVAIRGREQHLHVRLWRPHDASAAAPVGNDAASPTGMQKWVAPGK
jgi:adenylate cyclase